MHSKRSGFLRRGLASLLAAALAFSPLASTAQVIENGTATGIVVGSGFLFEPEVPFTSLKSVPIWNELEQLLDNPYGVSVDAATPGNDQGFPSYRATGVTRRPGFGVILPPFLVHPLNYNPTTGEEMRLLNPEYAGGEFDVTDALVEGPPGTFRWTRTTATISPGTPRIEVGGGTSPIDYSNPIPPDGSYPGPCVLVTEFNPPEGSTLCGGDPGEPGNPVFGGLGTITIQLFTFHMPPAPPPVVGTPMTFFSSNPALLAYLASLGYPPATGTTAQRFATNMARYAQILAVRAVANALPAAYSAFVGGTPTPGPLPSALNALIALINLLPTSVRNLVLVQTVQTQTDPNFLSAAYSTPGVPGVASPGTVIPAAARLYDPVRGLIQPRDATTGVGGLHKPSLRVPEAGGDPSNPHYLANIDPNDVTDSNENDYYRQANGTAAGDSGIPQALTGRTAAIALGKALFWDMQVGSDGVQSCGTCHFNGTGTDTRTKNQVNPNHIGGDNTFQIRGGAAPNSYDLDASDFPLHKLANPDIAGDPACTTPISADVTNVVLVNEPSTGRTPVVCSAGNMISDVNDVVSSMGVVFSPFTDIPTPGAAAFGPASNPTYPSVKPVLPDIRTAVPDPIPGFQGLRRVEPRNTPTMQAAGFNFDNFWDGRARHDFNGGSVFGAADPQTHVWANDGTTNGALTATRQLIRFASIASLATGPGLSEFEMSFAGRNWQKIGKKLLQTGVVPLANQLVDCNDSVLGPFSGQRVSVNGACTQTERPGLNVSYEQLIRAAYFPQLWKNDNQHLDGCYSTGTNTPQCPAGTVAIPVLNAGSVVDSSNDPFDGFVVQGPVTGAAVAANTSQFRQVEANFALFWGLSVHAWVQILVPDNTPFDQVLDANPGAFAALGEPGEPGLVNDQLMCGQSGADPNYCFTEVGNFKRDSNVLALQGVTGENTVGGHYVASGGTRAPGSNAPDPLLGLDIFFASNLSLKNPEFRTGRCGECHAIPTLTDHTMPFTSKINLMDAVAEFSTPGIELIVEPLARLRVISGFLLEAEINENGQDAVERRIVDQSIVPNPVDGLAYPGATAAGLPAFGPWTGADSAFLDNGMYNLGVRPITEDTGRGGNDAFGWPLSLSALMMKNLAGPDFNPGGDDPADGFAQPAAPGIALSTFNPSADPECAPNCITGGLFEETGQDQQINPGYEGEPALPMLPSYLGEFANNITVGDFPPEMDEAGGAIGGMVNTLTDAAMIEGFMDTLGPFNPGNVSAEVLNFGGFSDRPGDISAQMGTWPNVNRVGRMGSFKAPQLRNVELTGPYFHNGGKLTLRQVVDFYTRGGDFPISNTAHRDFNLVNMNIEVQSNLSEAEKVALVDFLLELTDDRNRFDKAPFDHPEVIIPLDGAAPDNTLGRAALLADPRFLDIKAVGAGGRPPFNGDAVNTGPEPTFLNVTTVRNNPNCDPGVGPISHYCH